MPDLIGNPMIFYVATAFQRAAKTYYYVEPACTFVKVRQGQPTFDNKQLDSNYQSIATHYQQVGAVNLADEPPVATVYR